MSKVVVNAPTEADRFAAILEKSKRIAQKDIVFYVESFVYIEDRDTAEIYVPFELWPGQKDALVEFDKNKFNIVLKARQLGFTWLALSYASRGLLFTQGYSVVALSRTEDEAKELVRRMEVIFKNMPDLIRPEKDVPTDWTEAVYSTTALSIEVKKSGEVSRTFKAFASSANASRSFTASLILLDEWAFQQFDREIWNSGLPTINRPSGGKVLGVSTINRGSLFEELFTTPDNGFNKMFLPWSADPRRTPEWYEATKKLLGDAMSSEYPASIEEALSVPGGAFFPELKREIQSIDEHDFVISENWRHYVSIDYGLDGLAVLWYALNENGDAIVYKEIFKGKQAFDTADRTEMIIRDAADEITRVNDGDPIYEWYSPPDLWNKNRDTGRSTQEIFALEYGIDFTKTSNNRIQGWLDVKEWLKPIMRKDLETGKDYVTSRMRISTKCKNLWKSLTGIQKDEHNWNDVASNPHAYTHMPDSLRAFCAGQPLPREMDKAKQKRAKWNPDQYDDYWNASEEMQPLIIARWGNPF